MPLDYLRRGVVAGLVAGLAFGLLTAVVANPLVGFADGVAHEASVEGGHHADGGHHEGSALVSQATTAAVSVLSSVLWGVLLGGVVFGAAFYLLEPAIPGTGPTRSVLAGAAGFVTVSGAPWLALPPAPPGAEQVLATGTRLQLYAGMMLAGALACLLAGLAYRRFRCERGRPTALLAAAVPLAALAVPAALAPAPGIEHGLPAALAAGLTGLVVLGQLFLWATMAGVHAWMSRVSAGVPESVTDGQSPDGHVTAD